MSLQEAHADPVALNGDPVVCNDSCNSTEAQEALAETLSSPAAADADVAALATAEAGVAGVVVDGRIHYIAVTLRTDTKVLDTDCFVVAAATTDADGTPRTLHVHRSIVDFAALRKAMRARHPYTVVGPLPGGEGDLVEAASLLQSLLRLLAASPTTASDPLLWLMITDGTGAAFREAALTAVLGQGAEREQAPQWYGDSALREAAKPSEWTPEMLESEEAMRLALAALDDVDNALGRLHGITAAHPTTAAETTRGALERLSEEASHFADRSEELSGTLAEVGSALGAVGSASMWPWSRDAALRSGRERRLGAAPDPVPLETQHALAIMSGDGSPPREHPGLRLLRLSERTANACQPPVATVPTFEGLVTPCAFLGDVATAAASSAPLAVATLRRDPRLPALEVVQPDVLFMAANGKGEAAVAPLTRLTELASDARVAVDAAADTFSLHERELRAQGHAELLGAVKKMAMQNIFNLQASMLVLGDVQQALAAETLTDREALLFEPSWLPVEPRPAPAEEPTSAPSSVSSFFRRGRSSSLKAPSPPNPSDDLPPHLKPRALEFGPPDAGALPEDMCHDLPPWQVRVGSTRAPSKPRRERGPRGRRVPIDDPFACPVEVDEGGPQEMGEITRRSSSRPGRGY